MDRSKLLSAVENLLLFLLGCIAGTIRSVLPPGSFDRAIEVDVADDAGGVAIGRADRAD